MNRIGSIILQDAFFKIFQRIFNWHENFVNTVSSNPDKGSRLELNTEINGDTNLDLQVLWKEILSKLIVAHLNINSIRNKFKLLARQIRM